MAAENDLVAGEDDTVQQEISQDGNSNSSNNGSSDSSMDLESNITLNQNEVQVMLRDLDQKLDENNAMLKRIERSIPSLYDRLDKIYIDVSSTLPKKKDRKGRKSKKGKDLKSSSRNVDTKSKKNKRAGKKDKGKNKNK